MTGCSLTYAHLEFAIVTLQDSPYWTFLADFVLNLEVRFSRIDARRTSSDGHSLIDQTAFNTDGFDIRSCDNVWVHHSEVWNQDDCFDVKDGTKNVRRKRRLCSRG